MPHPDNKNGYIKRLALVWLANIRTSLVRETGFRANFWLGFARQFIWIGAFIFLIQIIFQNTQSLNGWSKPEALIILALSRMIEGLIDTLVSRNIGMLPQSVQRGEFDSILLKPLPAQFSIAFKQFHLYYTGNIIGGLILFIYGLTHLPSLPPLSAWTSFFILILVSGVVFYSFLILVASLVFRLERLEALYGFMTLFTEPLTVPFEIFPRIPRIVITYLIPIAFIVFVPAQAITGKLHTWQIPVAILVAAIFLTLANLAWSSGLKKYTSASS